MSLMTSALGGQHLEPDAARQVEGTKMGSQDDWGREGRPEEVKRINQWVETELAEWAKRWKLDGVCIICRHCGGRQRLSDSGTPFENHSKISCASIPDPQPYPFADLGKILSGWHLALCFEEADHF